MPSVGIYDFVDTCTGGSDTADDDLDGICDANDLFIGDDLSDDRNGDGDGDVRDADADSDGVPDDLDVCADSAAGAATTDDGCSIDQGSTRSASRLVPWPTSCGQSSIRSSRPDPAFS